ncbi:MAG TPA: hypothetical protein DCE55_01740 [Planctomycetaceae bacterium]|nr:hypothetical protein [Planctomycetaceae bacterium]
MADPLKCVDVFGLSSSDNYEIYSTADGKQRIRFRADEAVTPSKATAGRNYSVDALAGVNGEGRVVVFEGRHRAIGVAHGDFITTNLGGIEGRPGWLDYPYDGSTTKTGPAVRNLTIDYDEPDVSRAEARQIRINRYGCS